MFVRVEVAVRPEFTDAPADNLLRQIRFGCPQVGEKVRWARLLDVHWLSIEAPREQVIPAITEIFHDSVTDWLFTGDLIPSAAGNRGGFFDLVEAAPYRSGRFWGLERRFRRGVTDNVAKTTVEAFQIILGGKLTNLQASSGKLLVVEGTNLDEEALALLARDVFCNELLESWTLLTEDELKASDRFHPDHVRWLFPRKTTLKKDYSYVEKIALEGMDDARLESLSKKRLLALNLEEMRAIRRHFSRPDLKENRARYKLTDPTDVELEILAQTWSEHCKHKIFSSKIEYTDETGQNAEDIPDRIESLFKTTISQTTAEMQRPWLISVFHDNAGIVAFDEDHALAVKVETHNSPSALDPYGGALTGIVGVNRDILGCGRGAKPIFNTNVFCVAPPDYSQGLPDGIKRPRRILDGVRRGVEDGGNKSGIPTINGALVFDDRYLGKPLIYCGTVGMMPRISAGIRGDSKETKVGDLICMVGGRVGKDGIHGATFSSLALDESSPTSAVQLGDPITQKRAADFLLEARDRGLFRTLTDNGAGGLSSSVGEMAVRTNGAKIDLALAKTKYPGLRPYEIVISESQERMTVAVPPDKIKEFEKLALARGSEVSVLGEFTDSGYFEINYGDKVVGLLELEFLHRGVPTLELKATWPGRKARFSYREEEYQEGARAALVALMGRPNLASKEWLIRQYDHEVQGGSVIKPLHTAGVGGSTARSGPNDAGVVKPKSQSWMGAAVGCGLNPKLSDIDPYLMAQASVDEAIRNILCVDVEYGRHDSVISLVDNFCWPDPTEDSEKAGALVRACYGLRSAARSLGIPIVSGKDSMKNDFKGKKDGKPVHISVPPTLLMTALGRVRDARKCRTADFKADGDRIYLLGGNRFGLVGSEFYQYLKENGQGPSVELPRVKGVEANRFMEPDWILARKLYSWIGRAIGKNQDSLRSMHDVSDGGTLCAISECLLARSMGASLRLPGGVDPWEFSFGEGFHSFVVTASRVDVGPLETEWRQLEIPFLRLGSVNSSGVLEVNYTLRGGDQEFWQVNTEDLHTAWKKDGYWE